MLQIITAIVLLTSVIEFLLHPAPSDDGALKLRLELNELELLGLAAHEGEVTMARNSAQAATNVGMIFTTDIFIKS